MSEQSSIRKLVLLPGMDGTGTLFAPFIQALPHRFEALPVSYPTDTMLTHEDLEGLIRKALPVSEPFILLAESFSTPLAVRVAAAKPEALKALILVAGFVTSPRRTRGIDIAPVVSLLRAMFHLLSPVIRTLLLNREASHDLVQAVRRTVNSVEPKVLRSRLSTIFTCDAREALAQVTIPILYLQATRDRLVPERCVNEILAIKPDTVVAQIDGPHLLLQSAPQRCAAAIGKFLDQLG